jgi:hypothetical protein
MKNKIVLFFTLLLAGCCTKKLCTGRDHAVITVVFENYSGSDLSNIYLKEYDRISGLQLDSVSGKDYGVFLKPNTLQLKFASGLVDSFSDNKRFYVISPLNENDTISDISYQVSNHAINCNHCPGENDIVHDVTNFSVLCKGRRYQDGDTIFLYK